MATSDKVVLQATYTVNGEVRPCPYAGRAFPVTIKFPPTYPFKCPEVLSGLRAANCRALPDFQRPPADVVPARRPVPPEREQGG